ncbi:DUF5103 domain-containing protein [Dysgonomonas sp. 25]|uniref:type IX secretion system plug protein n=1 Tax=Dysgonomonas sp. 25 TaxID=2302933 RepID=UPI0013D42288|nr:DUF5103 domain-containing protein [Dysgonomonas sp. 25]NDV67550.1 DUF5103 domain-containing protein [Dysgonomonas sp. 25]
MSKYISFLFLFFSVVGLSAQPYRTTPLSPDIKTIQVNAGEWGSLPVIHLNGNDAITLNFDYISDNAFSRLRYNIYHCDANWNRSRELSDIDFLDGFNDNLIDDYIVSLNTTVDYTNYNLVIPNNDVKLKLSGNYVVEVYNEDNPQKILLIACFSVAETSAKIGYKVSSITNIDANKEHQQVSLFVNHNLNLRDPVGELKVFVRQNNRLDNQRTGFKPSMITPTKISYEHNRELIFEAGNEYRRFETSSHRFNGMHVSSTKYQPPYYYASITPDKIRAGKGYSYDEDQNGRFMIRTADTEQPDNEADYFMTTFTLPVDRPVAGDVYLNGDFTYNSFNTLYRMEYDAVEGVYSLSMLLKQGLYNYQYLTKTVNGYSTAPIEGNYYETRNEYSAYVYYRPSGQRYDRLIGVQTFYSH